MNKCDLVMKGGITSGLVYPGAVLELSRDYRFVNIGGTSAGAIAAALTAAAELRRQRDGSSEGFDELGRLPAWMGESAGGRSRLVRLFEPSEETRPLFDAALALVEAKGSRSLAALRAIVRGFPRFGSIAASAGLLLTGFAFAATVTLRPHSGLLVLAMIAVILALLGGTVVAVLVAAIVEALLLAVRTLPKQGFGLCDGKSLTAWLADAIDSVAGVGGRPVTFGDLHARDIHLVVMTTNLTLGRPHRLPMENRHFSFDADELGRLFPERIVQWMIDHSEKERDEQRPLYALPGDELPLVVAARMSLSFPLLLSAVPLWAVDHGKKGEQRAAERCWFSDGGITSNFPVHFFDAPIPRWPTFAINLAKRTPRYHDPAQGIYMPRTNSGGLLEWWSPFETVQGFLLAIVNTMQNWRDTMLLRLPGQRDRIAHVLLSAEEGGLNLSMNGPTIARVAARGTEAGRTIRERFRWRNHKWLRYLAFMGALEESLEKWERAYDDELVGGTDPLPSYRISPPQRAAIRSASASFLRHVRETFGSRPFRTPAKRPRPMPEMRAMPRE